MDYKHIEELLEKYFEGQSSLEEEADLHDFFQRPQVPARLRRYQSLFRYFEDAAQAGPSAGFEERLWAELAAREPARRRRLWPLLTRAAAIILAIAAAWWLFIDTPAPAAEPQAIDWSKYEPATAEEAYRITRLALLRTSTELNRGAGMAAKEVDKVRNLGKYFK